MKWKNYIEKLGKRRVVASIISTLILMAVTYELGNISLPFSGDEIGFLKRYTVLKGPNKKNAWTDSVLLINTCYDIDTIPYYSYQLREGYVARTNRKHLYSVLKALKENNTYRHIMLDIQLDALPLWYNSYTDSIIGLISDMERITIAKSATFQLADTSLYAVAGGVDYLITPEENGFVKFSLIQNGEPSMPLKLYKSMQGRTLQKHIGGLIYTDGGALCHRMIIPTFDILTITPEGTNGSNRVARQYVNLDNMLYGEYHDEVKDKIIVFGDFFLHDIHDTYAGPLSGALINTNIYLSLCNGEHFVKWRCHLLLCILYMCLFFAIVYYNTRPQQKIEHLLPWHRAIIHTILSIVGWGILFNILAVIVYRVDGYVLNPWIPTLWFTVIPPLYITIYQLRNNENK